MKHRKTLSNKQLPTRLPVLGTLVWYLVLDKLGAPDWLWGVVATLFAILWIVAIIAIYTEDATEISELKS